MTKREIELRNATGLHARPASLFVKEASAFDSDIKVVKDGKEFNGKSIMGILSMGAGRGDKITIEASGSDENEAVDTLIELIENNFGE